MKMRRMSLIFAMLLAFAGQALAEEGLTVYYSHSSYYMDDIVREFQDRYDIAVTLVYGGTVELAQRVVKEADEPIADILWGGTPANYIEIADYLESYESPEDAYQYERFVDPNHRWHGFSVTPVVLAYNTRLVSESSAPQTYADLLNSGWKGQIALGDPTSSSTAFVGFLNILCAYEDEGYDLIEEILKQANYCVIGSSAEVYEGIASGKYTVGITYEEGVLRLMAEGAAIQIIYPQEGTNLNCSSVAIVKDAPHLAQAKLFIDFLLGKDVQMMLGSMFRHTVRNDLALTDTIASLEEIPDVGYTDEWAESVTDSFLAWWYDHAKDVHTAS